MKLYSPDSLINQQSLCDYYFEIKVILLILDGYE